MSVASAEKIQKNGNRSGTVAVFFALLGAYSSELYLGYMRDLFISIANCHSAKDIGALMPWLHAQRLIPSN